VKKLILAATLLMAFSTSFAAEKDNLVNLIGLDENGKELNIPIKSKKWKKRMAKVFKRVGGDVLPQVRMHTDSDQKFAFKQFDLGLYVKMKFGLGVLEESPVKLAMTVEPYFKLFFKK
jgi:hypothetical protein